MHIVLTILIYAFIVYYEVPKLVKDRLWKELWVFSIILFAAFVLSILPALGIPLIMPALPK